MSLIACSRRRLPTLQCLTRRNMSDSSREVTRAASASTSSKGKVLSHSTLPPPKMRALISLYHQADSWITPENLLQKIDDAFVPPANIHQVLTLPTQEGVTLRELKEINHGMRTAPRMAQLIADKSARQRPGLTPWGTTTRSKRETMVFEALYGVEVGKQKVQQALPGLELLQEMKDGLEKDRESDKKDKDALDVADLL